MVKLFIKKGLVLLVLFFTGKASFGQVKTDSVATDSTLLKMIEQQLRDNEVTDQKNPALTQQAQLQPFRSGLNFNPQIGVIGDFQGYYISEGSRNFDAYLNETEISFKATVDPYVKADFYVSLGKDDTGQYGVEIEEGFLTTLSLPASLQLKAGRFRHAFGRMNTVHPHALTFMDTPNAFENYFGDEGMKDEGLSLSWLVPHGLFYQELIVEATAGFTESPSFTRSGKNRFIYLAHLKNFFNLSDNTTLEIGLSGVTGPNLYSEVTNIGGLDLTLKWKPLRLNAYRSFEWQSELFYSHIKQNGVTPFKSLGLYSYAKYQLTRRWFLAGKYDYAQAPENNSLFQHGFSLIGGWYATEFQKIELQGKYTNDNAVNDYAEVWLRWIFIIGAHGAHQY